MPTQPEALRLADEMERVHGHRLALDSAAELRRLHEVNQELLEALEEFGGHHDECPQYPTYAEPENYPPCNCGFEKAITAIAKATGEQA